MVKDNVTRGQLKPVDIIAQWTSISSNDMLSDHDYGFYSPWIISTRSIIVHGTNTS